MIKKTHGPSQRLASAKIKLQKPSYDSEQLESAYKENLRPKSNMKNQRITLDEGIDTNLQAPVMNVIFSGTPNPYEIIRMNNDTTDIGTEYMQSSTKSNYKTSNSNFPTNIHNAKLKPIVFGDKRSSTPCYHYD